MSAAFEFASFLQEFEKRAANDPLSYVRLLPPQQAVAECPDRFRLFRGGNQALGKTFLGLAEVIWRCLGTHPYQIVRDPPIEAWVLCASWSQSIAIQQKFYNLCPKDAIHPDSQFDPVNGFRGKHPTCKFRNGSIVRFKTTQQSGLDLSGATVDFVLFDEPPASARVYAEVVKRVQARNGSVLLTLTPVNVDCTWLRELAENGQVRDLHFRLDPDNLIPVGASAPLRLPDGTLCDQQWVDQVIATSLPHEVPVTCHGEWEFRSVASLFADSFRHSQHVSDDLPDGECRLQLGIDWGSGERFSQYAVLVAVDKAKHISVLGEYVSSGSTTLKQDAVAILELLKAHGLQWSELDKVYGDRLWLQSKLVHKSNTEFSRELERQLGIRSGSISPAIHTVKRGQGHGRGSVAIGCRFLHDRFLANEITISPNCTRLIEALDKWDSSDNEYKHPIDGLRYSLDNLIFGRATVVPRPIYVA